MHSNPHFADLSLEEGFCKLAARLPHGTPTAVGVDHVEYARLRDAGPLERLATIVCSDSERHLFEAANGDVRLQRFARLVTLKEAAAKALCTGFGAALGWREVQIARLATPPLRVDIPDRFELTVVGFTLAGDTLAAAGAIALEFP